MRQVITAAKNAGKAGGCVAPTPASVKMAAELGYSFIVGAGDVPLLRETVATKLAGLRGALA